jgi:S1 RNA binding domain protein
VELPGGSTGLVHISEVADNYVKDINDHLKVGDQVEVKVLNVENGKIGLSIKKAKDRPEPEKKQYSQSQRPRQSRSNDRNNNKPETFESKMAKFLKDSEDRLSSLKRNTESKRGGRGARRG